MPFYKLTPKDFKGEEFPFEDLKGKIVLIVNVATKCGLVSQFKELEELNQRFAGQGVQILAFPCNQFGSQEPRSAVEIISFCSRNYGVTFPVLYKIKVNGKEADPVFKFLKSKKAGVMGIRSISWNFNKFLIDQNGEVVERYSSLTRPRKLIPKIEALLKAAEAK